MNGFHGLTPKEIKRMSNREFDIRGVEHYGFSGWTKMKLEALLPQVILFLIVLAGVGLFELYRWIFR